MKLRRIAFLTLLTATCAVGLVAAGPAFASPLWHLDIHHNETNFPPGGTGEYWFDVDNLGDEDTSGPVTLTLDLPPGLTLHSTRSEFFTWEGGDIEWSCPASPGDSTITCTTAETIGRNYNIRDLIVTVDVAPDANPDLVATATLAGGGAPEAPVAAHCPPGVAACASEPTHISSDPAPFGLVPGSWIADFYEADSVTPVHESGSHPDRATFVFDLNSIPSGFNDDQPLKAASGSLRHVSVDLPPGFVGNPSAVGDCTPAQLSTFQCPPTSVVGRADATVFPPTNGTRFNLSSRIYNMSHPRGVITDLGFVLYTVPVHVKVSLDPAQGYSVRAVTADINETLRPFHTKVTIWGVPGAASHDANRCWGAPCPLSGTIKPFLTEPFQCGVDNRMRIFDYDSWQETGAFGPEMFYEMPGQQTGCDKPRFEPSVSLEPTGKQASTPTGLDVKIHIPQNENPNGLGTPPIKSTTVTLPKGMVVSPAFADGLAGCSEAQIGLGTNDPVACPDNSRIGEIQLTTPLLPKPIEGSLYLAKQEENPFGSILALYLAVHDTEERGILVKVPAKIDLDPKTGQITSTFDDLPQFPLEDLTLKFRSGPRAPLTNPPNCGTHTIAVQMASYARPGSPSDVSNTYQVNEGPEGGPCQDDPAKRPFAPRLIGGTVNPLAGSFSPMSLRLSRTDAEQEISRVEGIAPNGLTASLKGVGRCSEAQIAAAAARNKPGQGALELASPSCPASSRVGTVETGVGAGQGLIYVPGKIYLAGPYKGAPLSGVAIVPAIAGPVDLGNVVVRAPAYVDPVTAQVRISSDPLPQIVHGVLVRVRDLRVRLDRPNFMLNPTSCAQKSIGATLFSTEGAVSKAANRFQVADCANLGFRPKLSLKLKGGTKRGDHPALKAAVSPRGGDANFANAVVTLPSSAFLDQSHIRTICTRVQYAAKGCPPAAQYGVARAWTPLLDEPLQGPVYLRSSNHKLPDLVAALHGIVDFDLIGRIDSFKGGIRSSFEDIPDVPVSRFVLEMQGGKKGLIVNSRNLCARQSKADAKLDAQNGKAYDFKPPVKPSCGGKAKKAK
jgi:hypothetical protein